MFNFDCWVTSYIEILFSAFERTIIREGTVVFARRSATGEGALRRHRAFIVAVEADVLRALESADVATRKEVGRRAAMCVASEMALWSNTRTIPHPAGLCVIGKSVLEGVPATPVNSAT